jgi:hypothetical protein
LELGSRPRPWNDQAKGHLCHQVKTYTVRASKEEPQYLIKSDKTDHMAMHKGAALKKIKSKQ